MQAELLAKHPLFCLVAMSLHVCLLLFPAEYAYVYS